MNDKVPVAVGLKFIVHKSSYIPVRAVTKRGVKILEIGSCFFLALFIGLVFTESFMQIWHYRGRYSWFNMSLMGLFLGGFIFFHLVGTPARSDDPVFEGRPVRILMGWTIFFPLSGLVIFAQTLGFSFIH